jgi:hypothetical protein
MELEEIEKGMGLSPVWGEREQIMMCLDNVANIFTILSFIVAVFAVIAAFFIPRKIMVNQIYADLLKEYRSAEMGEAIMGLIDFYILDCHRNVSLIEQEYKKIYYR